MESTAASTSRSLQDTPAGRRRQRTTAAPTPAGSASANVLVAMPDDERRRGVACRLDAAGHGTLLVADQATALTALASRPFDVMILDLALPGGGALDLLRALPSLHTHVEVLTVAAEPCVESVVEAMKLGARDLMCCPCDGEYLLLAVQRSLMEVRARRTLASLREYPEGQRPHGLVGQSAAMRHLLSLVDRVAPTRATVLITGETGTGKELVARAIHSASDRRDHPFIVVNCSAIPPPLLESELFGHVRGSFTGAIRSRKGLIEEAHGGTLFLDEIGTISLENQVKLLRVLEERRLQRVGANALTSVDFRLISATNEDLAGRVHEGGFREDLFFRLNVFPIHVAPLRRRPDDIPRLAAHFLNRYGREYDREPPRLTARAITRLMAYSWPGNVRELENAMERAVVMQCMDALFSDFESPDGNAFPETVLQDALEGEWTLERLEREYVLAVLERNDGERTAAAAQLGVNRRTVHRKLARYREQGLLA